MMSDEEDEFSMGPATKKICLEESKSTGSFMSGQSMALPSAKQEEEGESHLGDLAMPEAEGATAMYDVYKKMMENFQTPSDTFLTQFGPPELMYMTGDRISPKQLDSLSDDFTGLCKDGLMNEPDNAFAGEVENFTVSGDNPQVTEKFTLPKSSGEIDTDIKHQLMKEIRQFGRKYEKIFKLLEGVKGPLEVRRQYIEFTIKEAARFKRRDLIMHLERYYEIVADQVLSENNQ
ncbi:integrator complex subunit 6-like [Tupaia chinensis]|uniref:integrator complex subunit 6-like n=1 Tax=Tupaia chinensis TaxID=246437 RepID=UPI0003C8E26E|nr:integrator complex subunit 6-like [Tupaia chinensis]